MYLLIRKDSVDPGRFPSLILIYTLRKKSESPFLLPKGEYFKLPVMPEGHLSLLSLSCHSHPSLRSPDINHLLQSLPLKNIGQRQGQGGRFKVSSNMSKYCSNFWVFRRAISLAEMFCFSRPWGFSVDFM